MKTMTNAGVEKILSSWLSGAEVASGLANPAGPLYVGGAATEQALTAASDALYTGCSSCSGSFGHPCC